jgi:hypothetical protein
VIGPIAWIRYAFQHHRTLRERRALAASQQTADEPLHDPIEDEPETKAVIKAAEREAIEKLGGVDQGLGFCHRVWPVQKRILKKKHGIMWMTPKEMNPNTFFD